MPQSEQFDHTHPKLDNQVVTCAVYTHNTVGNDNNVQFNILFLITQPTHSLLKYVMLPNYQMSVGVVNSQPHVQQQQAS